MFILATASTGGLLFATLPSADHTTMYMEPSKGVLPLGELFTLNVIVESITPVNVFQSNITFDHAVIEITSIEYNTSIANLWAEEPWYSNGDGTLNFTGGTTQKGGFSGKGTLLTIHFKTNAVGSTNITLGDSSILQHDGYGTPIALSDPIDPIFTIIDPESSQVTRPKVTASNVQVLNKNTSTDLNQDGVSTLTDISMYMRFLATQNIRADFNGDGVVSMKDLSILLDSVK